MADSIHVRILAPSAAKIRSDFQPPRGWEGAVQVAGNVAHAFAREPRFWHLAESCRRGTIEPSEAARHLVPLLRTRALRVVELYLTEAAHHLGRQWPPSTDPSARERMIGFELANLGGNIHRIGDPNPFPRTHSPHAQLAGALERLKRTIGLRCLECGAKLRSAPPDRPRRGVVPHRPYYCSPHSHLQWRVDRERQRLRKLLAQAEIAVDIAAVGATCPRRPTAASWRAPLTEARSAHDYGQMTTQQLAELSDAEFSFALRALNAACGRVNDPG